MQKPPPTQGRSRRLQTLLAWAERIGQTGSSEVVPSKDEHLWSDNLYRIFGLAPGDVQPSVDYVLAHVHPDDRTRLEGVLAAFLDGGGPVRVEYRFTRPDGDRRHLRSTLEVAETRDGHPYRTVGLTEDLTDRRRAEREIAAHVAVQEALAEWEDLESGAHRLLGNLAVALDCVRGVFSVPRGDVLVPRVLWHDSEVEPEFAAAQTAGPPSRASGLAARAWEARKPLSWTLGGGPAWSAEAQDTEARDDALSGAIAIPALAGDEVLAIIELSADREIRVGERLLRSLYGIAHELGHFLARRGGELSAPLLTAREVQTLQLAAQGLSAKETAERLTIAPGTVKTHLENIYRKLAVTDKPSAVATALRLGIID